jgi:hypothetical protein
MSGILQILIGVLGFSTPERIVGDAGIIELHYLAPNHLLTTNKGITWSSTGTAGESYGGLSSANVFLHNPEASHKKYNFNLSTNITIGTGSISRYHINPNTGVIIRQVYDTIERSTNGGTTWTTVHTRSPSSSFSNGFHYGNGVWFHYYTQTGTSPRTVHSLRSTDDGLTWSSSGITGIPDSTGFFGHSFYANGYHYLWHPNGYVYRSTDALTWSLISTTRYGITSPYGQGNLPFYLNGYIYVVDYSAARIYRSTDAITWETFGTVIAGARNLAYMNGNWVIASGTNDGVNSTLTIYTSSDNAVTWTQRYTISGNIISGDIYYEDIPGLYGLNQHYTL